MRVFPFRPGRLAAGKRFGRRAKGPHGRIVPRARPAGNAAHSAQSPGAIAAGAGIGENDRQAVRQFVSFAPAPADRGFGAGSFLIGTRDEQDEGESG
jgi:hypothetical protein